MPSIDKMLETMQHNVLELSGAISHAGGSPLHVLTETKLLVMCARNNILLTATYTGTGEYK